MLKRKTTLEVGNTEGLELLRESLRHVQEEAHIPEGHAHTFVVLVSEIFLECGKIFFYLVLKQFQGSVWRLGKKENLPCTVGTLPR